MTSHPPDEYTQQARSLLERMTPKPYASDVEAVAEAIADAYRRGAEEMREAIIAACEERAAREMADAGHPIVNETVHGAQVARSLASRIAALPTGPAAPEGEHATGDVWERDPADGSMRTEAAEVERTTCLRMSDGELWTPEELHDAGWRRVRRGGGA